MQRIPDDTREAFAENSRHFRTPIQLVQFMDKYARWNGDARRRETWAEAVQRVTNFLDEIGGYHLPVETISEIHDAILDMRIMPSMRVLAMAGPAARRNNISIYNCAAEGIDHPYAFVESLIISMAGTGAGFSVESRFVDQLPPVVQTPDYRQAASRPLSPLGPIPEGNDGPIVSDAVADDLSALMGSLAADSRPVERDVFRDPLSPANSEPWRYVLKVRDSSEGWAEALAVGLAVWWQGMDFLDFDYSEIRAKGAPLLTKGGTASGPDPLRDMLVFVREVVLGARGRKITTLEAHDVQCKIADCVVSGGVRRSAMISLFDFDDHEMAGAKPDGFWDNPDTAIRKNANNSAVWPDRVLTRAEVADFMNPMFDRGTGENGIFIRRNAWSTSPARRRALYRTIVDLLTNPCGEIYLLNGQFCNLSIVVARPGMTRAEYLKYARLAAIVGTIQSAATHFPGLRPKWKENSERERLLGVDITGQADVGHMSADLLEDMKAEVIRANVWAAGLIGINASAATTCVKPGGNSSVFLGCSSGIGEPWAPYYIRRMTLEKGGVIARVLEASGWELEDSIYSDTQVHALFPMHAPGRTKQDVSALDQCEVWLTNKLHWAEHNPSCTITYREHEREDLIDWIHNHQDVIGGMAFLPASDHAYPQAPYETISRERFEQMSAALPPIDMAQLWAIEDRDMTTSAREVACSAGACDIL